MVSYDTVLNEYARVKIFFLPSRRFHLRSLVVPQSWQGGRWPGKLKSNRKITIATKTVDQRDVYLIFSAHDKTASDEPTSTWLFLSLLKPKLQSVWMLCFKRMNSFRALLFVSSITVCQRIIFGFKLGSFWEWTV